LIPIEFVNALMSVVRSVRKYSTSGSGYFTVFTIFFDQYNGLVMRNRNLHYRNRGILAMKLYIIW